MDQKSTSDPLEAAEAWRKRARREIRGLKTELRKDGRSPGLRDRAYALRDELDAHLRALEKLAEEEGAE